MVGPLMGVVITSADEKNEENSEYLYIVSPVRLN